MAHVSLSQGRRWPWLPLTADMPHRFDRFDNSLDGPTEPIRSVKSAAMPKLILVRHGQSLWNLEDRFTGWVDVPLTELGREEARKAGERLRDIDLQVAYTSV